MFWPYIIGFILDQALRLNIKRKLELTQKKGHSDFLQQQPVVTLFRCYKEQKIPPNSLYVIDEEVRK